jgi:hypothetical protein
VLHAPACGNKHIENPYGRVRCPRGRFVAGELAKLLHAMTKLLHSSNEAAYRAHKRPSLRRLVQCRPYRDMRFFSLAFDLNAQRGNASPSRFALQPRKLLQRICPID